MKKKKLDLVQKEEKTTSCRSFVSGIFKMVGYGIYGIKGLFNSNVVVIFAAFWVNFCLLGVLRSNAVIYKAFVDVYEVNRQHAAWPSGIFGFFMCVTGASSGFLTHYFSIRTLAVIGAGLASLSVTICSFAYQMPLIVFLYGALQGIGMGLIVPLTHVILNQNFLKFRALALGIAYSGSSVGSFIFPVLSNMLLMEFGLHGTFMLLGGIMFNSLIGALLFRKPRPMKTVIQNKLSSTHIVAEITGNKICEKTSDSEQNEYQMPPFKKKEVYDKPIFLVQKSVESAQNAQSPSKKPPTAQLVWEILSSSYFFIVSLAYAIYFSNSAIFLMVALDFAKDRGINAQEGVFLISAFSFGDLLGRLTFGWIADTKFVRRNLLVRCYFIAMGVLTAVLPIFPANLLPAASAILGLFNGSIIVNHSVLLTEYLGLQKLPLAMGFSTCFVGVTAFLRPVIIGAFRDGNQSYDCVFLFMGLLQIAVSVLWFIESFVIFTRRKS